MFSSVDLEINTSMRVAALGLDVGSKRIGVAGCDGLGLIATGITTIWRSSFQEDIAQLNEIILDRQVEILVLGLPYTMDGNLGSQAKQVQKFARRVAAVIELPIEYVDERLTSYAAEEMMKAANISVSQNKATIDRIAAAVILQQWLDARVERATIGTIDIDAGRAQGTAPTGYRFIAKI
jgi:putative holliday junction resolvase